MDGRQDDEIIKRLKQVEIDEIFEQLEMEIVPALTICKDAVKKLDNSGGQVLVLQSVIDKINFIISTN